MDTTSCCQALIRRKVEWRPWPHWYRVCDGCGFEVDAGGWPVQQPGIGWC